MLSWESLDAGIHVEATWHQPSTQTPLADQARHLWHQHGQMALVAQQDNVRCHTTNTAQERDKEFTASTWPQITPDPTQTELHGTCQSMDATAECCWPPLRMLTRWSGNGFYGSKEIHINTRIQGFHYNVVTVCHDQYFSLHSSVDLMLRLISVFSEVMR